MKASGRVKLSYIIFFQTVNGLSVDLGDGKGFQRVPEVAPFVRDSEKLSKGIEGSR